MADTTTRIYELQVKLAQESLAQLKKLQTSTAKVESQFSSLSGAVKNFGIGLASALSVGALIAAVDSTIQKLDELGAAAQRAGVGIETFSALAYAAEQSDLALADLETGFKELQKSMVETETKGSKVLDALKIDKSKAPVEVLKDFAEAFKTIHEPALRTNALIEVFGKAGLKLRPMLEQGAAGMEALMQKAKELGFVIDEQTNKTISDLDNTLKTAGKSTELLMRDLVVGLAPSLTAVAEGFSDAAKTGGAFETVGKAIGLVVRVLGGAALFVAHTFKQLGTTTGGVAAMVVAVADRNFAGAAAAVRAMGADLAANEQTYSASMEKILGLADATKEHTGALDTNTRSTVNNDAAIRKALDTQEKDKKAIAARAKALKELNAAWVKMIDQQQEAARVEGLAANKGKSATQELEEQEEQLKKNNEQWVKMIDQQIEVERAAGLAANGGKTVTQTFEKQGDVLEALGDKIDGYAKSISSTFIDFVSGANDAKFSFSDFANSVLRDLAKMVTQLLLIEPLMANLKRAIKDIDWGKIFTAVASSAGGDGGGFGGIGDQSAKGNVYASRSLSRYSGGIYDTPRVFSFAKGAGVFAEAGPEAIMPLKRNAQGELGVDTSGAGGEITINVYNESRAQVQTDTRRDINGNRVIELLVKDAVSKGIRSGAFDAVMGSTYGLNRQGAR